MKPTRTTVYFFAVLLSMLGGCKNNPAPSVSEYTERIEAARETETAEQRLALIDSAIATHPEEPSFYFERGICKSHMANDTGKIADLSRAIQLAHEKDCPTYYQALLVRGFAWMHQGKHQAAFDDFWAAARTGEKCQPDPDQLDSYYWNAGLVARQQLRFDLIDSVSHHWELYDPASNGLTRLRAETYRLKRMPEEALLAYNLLLQDTSEQYSYDLWMGRAKTLIALGKKQDAQQDLVTAKGLVDAHILRTKDSLAFSDALAEILFLRGDYSAAIALCDRFLPEGDPLCLSKLHFTRGEALQALGQSAQACADWKQSAAFGWGEARQKLAQHCKE